MGETGRPTHVDTPKSPELSIFEQMFRQIQEMVEGNRQEIQSLKGELAARQSRREDTTRIQARLEDEEHRSQELLDKLAETESRLATSEAQVKKQRELEFTESELAELRKYSTIIVFDTCSIMNCPNLLDGVNDGELVVVPKDVNNELEHHKTKTFLRLPKLLSMMRVLPSQERLRLFLNWKRRSLRQRQRKPQLWKAARKNDLMQRPQKPKGKRKPKKNFHVIDFI